MQLRLFGGFEWTGGAERLRSGTCEQVLALLATRPSLSRTALADAVWPESEGDRQSQNLRKALSNIRAAFGEGSSALLVEGDRVGLCPQALHIDLHVFRDESRSPMDRWAHYRGPFCEGWETPWVLAERQTIEREYTRLSEQVGRALLDQGQFAEAAPILEASLRHLPLAEDLHLLLLRAYAGLGRSLDAIRHLEAWEALLDEEYGETPPPEAARIVERMPRAVVSMAPQEAHLDRPADRLLAAALARGEPTILVHGPRQTGKSSLVGRSTVVLGDKRVVACDLSQLTDAHKADQHALYVHLAQALAAPQSPPPWQSWLSPNANLEAALRQGLDQPLVWVLDPVDALFGTGFQDDFFGLLRSWHNRVQLEPKGWLAKLQVVLVYSAEAHLFIRDLNQSPFNVGFAVPLQDFRPDEVALLAERMGTPHRHVATVLETLGGQPALTKKALEILRDDPQLGAEFYAYASDLDGPFGSHLRRLIQRIRHEAELVEAMRSLLRGELPTDRFLVSRLRAGGLIRRTADGFEWRVPIYREAFREFWGEKVP